LTALNDQLQTKSPFFSRAMASQSLPNTMEGVVINKTGGTDVLEFKTDLPVPQPKENEVLIKNEYVGVNYIDTCVTPKPLSILSFNAYSDRFQLLSLWALSCTFLSVHARS
jgi:hypothetical protein